MVATLIPDSYSKRDGYFMRKKMEINVESTLKNSVRADVGPRTLLGRLIEEKLIYALVTHVTLILQCHVLFSDPR